MTKKDFELIANTFSAVLNGYADNDSQRWSIEGTAKVMADTLEAAYPRFDRNKFLIACGVK